MIDNCPNNIVVEVEIGVGGTPVTWAIPTATDNSGVAPTVVTNYNPGDFFDVGSTLVVYTFTDGAGNEVQCAFNIAVTGGMSSFSLLIEDFILNPTLPIWFRNSDFAIIKLLPI